MSSILSFDAFTRDIACLLLRKRSIAHDVCQRGNQPKVEGQITFVARRSDVSGASSLVLQLPGAFFLLQVGRIHRILRNGHYAERVAASAPVYLAAVMEYLTAEVLELAGNAARGGKKMRITPRHLQLAVRTDEELNRLLTGVVIAQGKFFAFPPAHLTALCRWRAAERSADVAQAEEVGREEDRKGGGVIAPRSRQGIHLSLHPQRTQRPSSGPPQCEERAAPSLRRYEICTSKPFAARARGLVFR